MLKLSVGFTKKVGESNYGSRGASTNLELELDSGLVGDPDRLKERVRHLYQLAKQTVEEELAAGAMPTGLDKTSTKGGQNGNGNGHSAGSANGRRRDGTRPATASQIRALNTIADRRRFDLLALLGERFQIQDVAALTITEASALIDELKNESIGNGQGGRR